MFDKNSFMKNVLVTIAVVLISGCSSTKVTTAWTAKNVTARTYNKILVLGLIKDNDVELRKGMEQHLVDDLTSHGCTAVSTLDEYGPKAFEGMDEEKALRKIRKSGFDAVMTIVLLNKEQEKEYIPPRIYYSPYVGYYGRFWGYYTTMNSRIYEAGYYQENTKYFWESNFYTMEEGRKLIYSVQTKSFNPGSASSLAHEYGKLIVHNMISHGVLVNTNGINH